MLGAIAGDIIGSVHEFNRGKRADFPLFVPDCDFTDDTVLTVAVADCELVTMRGVASAFLGSGIWYHIGGGVLRGGAA